jgi:hypothetical protein
MLVNYEIEYPSLLFAQRDSGAITFYKQLHGQAALLRRISGKIMFKLDLRKY